jgi:hypothetical protein
MNEIWQLRVTTGSLNCFSGSRRLIKVPWIFIPGMGFVWLARRVSE